MGLRAMGGSWTVWLYRPGWRPGKVRSRDLSACRGLRVMSNWKRQRLSWTKKGCSKWPVQGVMDGADVASVHERAARCIRDVARLGGGGSVVVGHGGERGTVSRSGRRVWHMGPWRLTSCWH